MPGIEYVASLLDQRRGAPGEPALRALVACAIPIEDSLQ